MKSKQDFLTAKESLGIYQAHVLQTVPLPATEGSVQAAAGHSDSGLQSVCVCVQIPCEITWLKCGPDPAQQLRASTCMLMRRDTLKAATDSH